MLNVLNKLHIKAWKTGHYEHHYELQSNYWLKHESGLSSHICVNNHHIIAMDPKAHGGEALKKNIYQHVHVSFREVFEI